MWTWCIQDFPHSLVVMWAENNPTKLSFHKLNGITECKTSLGENIYNQVSESVSMFKVLFSVNNIQQVKRIIVKLMFTNDTSGSKIFWKQSNPKY